MKNKIEQINKWSTVGWQWRKGGKFEKNRNGNIFFYERTIFNTGATIEFDSHCSLSGYSGLP